ncbi:hypothetical protein [Pandoraea sp. XY-2]|uniref:hypothetical protein n=1 Tax=Pandoraea sp. XY-2 TaxID=2518599 RepID=UPI0010215150|nr:hypothetical protein [Pandoraea sp. XY-2]
MSLFHFPKAQHTRQLQPKQFKRYQTYKRYLQVEFSRVCVYCRQPDSSAVNLNFGVDHYRPKGLPQFAALVCTYTNLYYCCGSCNSRKNDDWPIDETTGQFVVNPCDFKMADHLRYDSTSGRISARTDYGQHTVNLLQLNDPNSVEYRLNVAFTVDILAKTIADIDVEIKEVGIDFDAQILSAADRSRILEDLDRKRRRAVSSLQAHTGTTPLPLQRKIGTPAPH